MLKVPQWLLNFNCTFIAKDIVDLCSVFKAGHFRHCKLQQKSDCVRLLAIAKICEMEKFHRDFVSCRTSSKDFVAFYM